MDTGRRRQPCRSTLVLAASQIPSNQQTLVAAASYLEPHLVCFARMGTNRPDGLVSNLTALVSLVSHSVFMVLTLPIYLSLRSQWVRGPVQIEILAFQGAPTS